MGDVHGRIQRRGIGVLIVVLSLVSTMPALTITDGTPKKILVHDHNSWQLGFSSDQLKSLGMGSIVTTRDGIGSALGVDTTASVVAGGWLDKFDASGESLPVILIVYASDLPVDDPDDADGIALGVRMLEKVAQTAKSKGADEVFFSGEHLAWFRYRDYTNRKKHRYYDHLVFAEYDKKVGKPMCADVRRPSVDNFGITVKSDLEHPSGYGKELYRNRWLDMFYRHDGKQVPVSVGAELEKLRGWALDGSNSLTQVVPADVRSIAVGDEVTLRMISKKDNVAYVRVLGYIDGYAGLFIVKDSIPMKAGQEQTFSFRMPDTAAVSHYGVKADPFPTVRGDSIQIQVFYGRESWSGMSSDWYTGPVMQYVNKDGSSRMGSVSVAPEPRGAVTLRMARPLAPNPAVDAAGRVLSTGMSPWRSPAVAVSRQRGLVVLK